MKKYFYEINVLTLTVVLPLVFALVETTTLGWSIEGFLFSLAKWTIFWAIGVRLLTAGMSQIIKPAFTSRTILGIKSPEATQLVRELGFANFATGVAGILSIILPSFTFWTPAVGLIGGLFLGLAGIEHIRKKNRNFKENLALVTDILVAVIALSFSITLIILQLTIPHFG